MKLHCTGSLSINLISPFQLLSFYQDFKITLLKIEEEEEVEEDINSLSKERTDASRPSSFYNKKRNAFYSNVIENSTNFHLILLAKGQNVGGWVAVVLLSEQSINIYLTT